MIRICDKTFRWQTITTKLRNNTTLSKCIKGEGMNSLGDLIIEFAVVFQKIYQMNARNIYKRSYPTKQKEYYKL